VKVVMVANQRPADSYLRDLRCDFIQQPLN